MPLYQLKAGATPLGVLLQSLDGRSPAPDDQTDLVGRDLDLSRLVLVAV